MWMKQLIVVLIAVTSRRGMSAETRESSACPGAACEHVGHVCILSGKGLATATLTVKGPGDSACKANSMAGGANAVLWQVAMRRRT
jgi:hypothetical protein